MNTDEKPEASGLTPQTRKGDSAKLASLLTLAAGAIALPQSAEADIIVTDLSASPVRIGYLYDPSFTISNLPGTARMGFEFVQQGTSTLNYVRGVLASQVAGYVRIKTNAYFVVHVPAGLAWNQVAGFGSVFGTMGIANYGAHTPNSYNHEYMLFQFKDSTQGNAMRYGWAEVSLFNGNIASSEGPDVTVWRYAYDTTGAQLPTGQVPEPSAAALLALGALALGSKGLRCWRRNKAVS
jgi:hypothetical protein